MTTDAQLHRDVPEELKWRPSVNAVHIGATAKNGVVTLTGQVAHCAEKSAAEEAAKGVHGVEGLANDTLGKNGWVTLTDSLEWQFHKDAAARSVRNLMGVIAVSNGITIEPEAKWTDARSKIEDSFRRHADLEARRISVSTDSGTVAPTGSVASWAERDQAWWAAWSAPGGTLVTNDLTIVS